MATPKGLFRPSAPRTTHPWKARSRKNLRQVGSREGRQQVLRKRMLTLGTLVAGFLALAQVAMASDTGVTFTTVSTGTRTLTVNVAPSFGAVSLDLNSSHSVSTSS